MKHRGFGGNKGFLYDITMVNTCYCTFVNLIECKTPRVTHSVKHALWVIMCHCRFIYYNACTTLLWDVHSITGYACKGFRKTLYFLFNFSVNLRQL